jgi:integrase
LAEIKQQQERINSLPDSGTTYTTTLRRIFQVDEGHRSRQTETKYRSNFNHFLNYIRIHDLDVFLDLGKEAIQELVIKYVLSMRDNPDKRYSRHTVNNRVSAILYFLDNNDIELNKRKVRRYFPSDESVNDDRPYTSEEVQRILAVSDLRSKAMILLMVSSGIRVGSLSSMLVGDLAKIEYHMSILYKVQVYACTRDKYYTFCTPECYIAIQEYLNFRKRYGEEIKDKSPLFREHFNKDNQFTINVKGITHTCVLIEQNPRSGKDIDNIT